MAIVSVDIGLVSATDAIVDFYRDALDLEVLEARTFPFATVHRLACGSGVLKVMVPTAAPAPPDRHTNFWDAAGLRYVTLWVDDLDVVVGRWKAHGGTVTLGPMDLRPGVRTALLVDPDGNTVETMQESPVT